MRSTDKKPVSFVWRFPDVWRTFIATDTVRKSPRFNGPVGEFMADCTNYKNIRAPSKLWMSVPNFWGHLLPYQSSPDNTSTVRTYVRLNIYIGATFRGRRIMDDDSEPV